MKTYRVDITAVTDRSEPEQFTVEVCASCEDNILPVLRTMIKDNARHVLTFRVTSVDEVIAITGGTDE